MTTKQKIDYSKIAKELAEPAIELMADLLIKHDKAILEEIHERLKKPSPDDLQSQGLVFGEETKVINMPEDMLKMIAVTIANHSHMPYIWENIMDRLKMGEAMPFKIKSTNDH